MSDPMLDNNNEALITASEAKSMATWSDQKRESFVQTFEERTTSASYILQWTAEAILGIAIRRKFISTKHTHRIVRTHHNGRLCNRNSNELRDIAENRAKTILNSLPTLKQAVSVVDKETAERIEELEKLEEQLQQLKDQLDDLSEPINLAEVDQKMTIKEFHDHVKQRQADKEKLYSQIKEKGKNAQELDILINKTLYAGIPGLSDAVIKIVNEHYQRITALDNMTRRVAERVKFGDSPEALSLLEHFEKDEMQISDNIKAEFDKALEVLNLSKKQLKGNKSSTKPKGRK